MKKYYCIGILFLYLTLSAVSQDLAVGIKVGISNPFYFGNDYQNKLLAMEQYYEATYPYNFDFHTMWKIGLSIGAFATIVLSINFTLQPELLFSALGGRQLMGRNRVCSKLG